MGKNGCEADDEASDSEEGFGSNAQATTNITSGTVAIDPYAYADFAQIASGAIIIACILAGMALNWNNSDHHFGH